MTAVPTWGEQVNPKSLGGPHWRLTQSRSSHSLMNRPLEFATDQEEAQ